MALHLIHFEILIQQYYQYFKCCNIYKYIIQFVLLILFSSLGSTRSPRTTRRARKTRRLCKLLWILEYRFLYQNDKKNQLYASVSFYVSLCLCVRICLSVSLSLCLIWTCRTCNVLTRSVFRVTLAPLAPLAAPVNRELEAPQEREEGTVQQVQL